MQPYNGYFIEGSALLVLVPGRASSIVEITPLSGSAVHRKH
jgi:hypothetical protein